MKQNKWSIIWISLMTILALCLAWKLDCLNIAFWSNVFLGIFGSGLLTVMVAIINYSTERRKALESFWVIGHKAARIFNKYPIDGTIDEKIEAILLINEFDFTAFGDAYAAIDFLFGNKKTRKKIYDEIYRPVRDTGHTITNCAANIVRLRRAIPDNTSALESYIANADKKFIKTEVSIFESDDGSQTEMTYTSNRMTDLCYERFNGFYWKIMYPLKKQEEEENAD